MGKLLIYCYSITFFEIIVIVSAIKKIVIATWSVPNQKIPVKGHPDSIFYDVIYFVPENCPSLRKLLDGNSMQQAIS